MVTTVRPMTPVPLMGGRITAELDGPDLRGVRVDGTEVLRRVYVAVRDRNWDTVPATVVEQDVQQGDAGFQVDLLVRHQRHDVAIEWRGRITASAEGRLTYAFDGAATSAFMRRRIGMCVHHPVDGLAGHPCTVIHGDGSSEETVFPLLVEPHQPFRDVRAIRHGVGPGVGVEIGFHGTGFETEDHRNWTDASFKTYATPMADGAPVAVAVGDRWGQAVTLQVTGPVPHTSRSRAAGAAPITVRVLDANACGLPMLGVMLPEPGAVTPSQVRLLRMARLGHIRVDLDLSASGWGERLARAWSQALEIGAPLEVALHLGEATDEQLSALASVVGEVRPEVRRWIVFRVGQRATGPELVCLARAWLGSHDPSARFGTGSSDFFAPLNRLRPDTTALDFVSYGVSPQVHASDDRSIIENLDGQPWTVLTAKSFSDVDVVVSPIMLRPWSNPIATEPYPASPGAPPDWADPRQAELLAAGWTLGSIRRLAAAGAAACTYYHATGLAGLMPAAQWPGRWDAAGAEVQVHPLFHVLADVGEVRSGTLRAVHASERSVVDGLAVRADGRTRLLLANLTGEAHEVVINGLDGPVTLRLLDERTQALATSDPMEARRARWTDAPGADGRLPTELGPYAVVCMDIPA